VSPPTRARPAEGSGLADRIDAVLPQTQCRRCGFEGCRPYAEALAQGETAINRCPPGGTPVIRALAGLVGTGELPLDAGCGSEEPPRVALVVEADCIGCAKCIDACPTDAVVGARKWLHAVIAADCSGCELCLPACPVDCIVMAPAPGLPPVPLAGTAIARRASHYRALQAARQRRLERNQRRWREALESRLGSGDDP
jgi:electron transport complex protein RnfB